MLRRGRRSERPSANLGDLVTGELEDDEIIRQQNDKYH